MSQTDDSGGLAGGHCGGANFWYNRLWLVQRLMLHLIHPPQVDAPARDVLRKISRFQGDSCFPAKGREPTLAPYRACDAKRKVLQAVLKDRRTQLVE